MELKTRNLFIDTQFFVNKGFNFESSEIKSLINFCHKELVNLYLVDLTVKEIEKKIEDELEQAFNKLDSSSCRALKNIPLYQKFRNTYDLDKAIQFHRRTLYKFIEDCNTEIIKVDSISCNQVFNLYFEKKPPFAGKTKKNRKNEFPDAFILKTIADWSETKKKNTYVLSGDSDWAEFCENNYIFPIGNDEPNLIHIGTLSIFLDSIIRNEKALVEMTKFSDDLFENNKEKIIEKLKSEIERSEFESDLAHEDYEIVQIGILPLSIEENEMLSIEKESSSYNVILHVNGIFEYSCPDYSNSIWDSETKQYAFLEYSKFFKRNDFEIEGEIEISFLDRIDGNFQIKHIGIPSIIEVPFENGEVINIDEWVKMHPVIVCGVDDGKITDDGLGAQEFKNFNDAKRVFPDLNIHKNSKNFTGAFGNKLSGPLRFETWKANQMYSS